MIAVAGTGASLLDLLLVRPLVSAFSILGLAGLSLYAMLVLVLSAGALSRDCGAPSAPRRPYTLIIGAQRDGVRETGRPDSDVAPRGAVLTLLVQSRLDLIRQARGECRFGWLRRASSSRRVFCCWDLRSYAVQTFSPTPFI
jgi:hypothetical protein